MKELLIGSMAIRESFPDFPRQPKDIDFAISEDKGRRENTNIEYLYNPVIFKYQDYGTLKPDLLLSLKISHLFWDINWEKHLFDVQFLLSKGCKYNLNLISELRSFWESHLPKIRRSRLSMSKDSFFKNAVNEDTEQHDYLHTLLNPIPMYTKLLKEGCEVELDESKWNNLNFEEKCDVVFEETAVMAFERYKTTDYRTAYKKQLKDNIIKHFPSYIAIFAIEKYKELEKPKYNFKTKIENELQIN
jgi:hypothetical protein